MFYDLNLQYDNTVLLSSNWDGMKMYLLPTILLWI